MTELTCGKESKQAPGVGDGQGSLACCSPRGCKESDTIERLNWIQGRKIFAFDFYMRGWKGEKIFLEQKIPHYKLKYKIVNIQHFWCIKKMVISCSSISMYNITETKNNETNLPLLCIIYCITYILSYFTSYIFSFKLKYNL